MRRNALLFVAISLLSGLGGSAISLVTGVWILDLTGSASLAALAGLCVYAPQLAGPWVGAALDRVPRRPLVVGVNLALAAVMLSLFAVHNASHTWLIFTVSVAYGAGYVLIGAGETALLPSALSPTELGDVNGWRSSAKEGMKLVGPVAGAGLYTWHGAHTVAAVTAAMPVLVAALYGALRLAPMPPSPISLPAHHLRRGLAVLRGDPILRVTVALAAVSIAMSGFQTAPTYAIVTAGLGLPATFLGVLGGAQGAGSILGGLIVGRFIAFRGAIAVGMAGTILFAVGCLIRCLPWWQATVASGAVIGIGLPWTLVAALTAVQTRTPTALLGRVAATANTAMFGPIVLAFPLGSIAVEVGGRPSLIVAALVCLTTAAVAYRRTRRNDGGTTQGVKGVMPDRGRSAGGEAANATSASGSPPRH
jgi:Major Facilitator Superfamily